jgi:preprotein translocase YajC subunit
MSDASIISAVVIAIVAYVYFTIVRPARRDQAEHRRQIQGLRPGDQVLTTANFVATIKDIQVPENGPSRIRLELADGVVVTALPGAILRRLTPAETAVEAQVPPGQKGAT